MTLKQTDKDRTDMLLQGTAARSGNDAGIVIARHGNHYRLLHGQLRLVATLHAASEIAVDVKDEGEVRIVKACDGLQVVRGAQRLPLLRDQ